MTNVLVREEEAHRECNVRIEAEIGVVWFPQAKENKEGLEPAKLEGARRNSPLKPPEGAEPW